MVTVGQPFCNPELVDNEMVAWSRSVYGTEEQVHADRECQHHGRRGDEQKR